MSNRLMMIRVFNPALRLIGYVDAKVARLAERQITPNKPFKIELFRSLEELTRFVTHGSGSVASIQVVTAWVEMPVFYAPGKYATGPEAAPPDGVIHNLIIRDYPDNLWEHPGWYKRQT